jgi:hypothetical protein
VQFIPGRSLVTVPLPPLKPIESGSDGAAMWRSQSESCTSHHEPPWP